MFSLEYRVLVMDDLNYRNDTGMHDNFGQVHGGSGDIINNYYQNQTIVLSGQEKNTLLDEYALWQKERYAHLPISGIPIPFHIDISLDQVYIKLRTLPQQKQSQFVAS